MLTFETNRKNGAGDAFKSVSWFPSVERYALPGKQSLSLNKVDWSIESGRTALLVHDMQKFWVDRFVEPDELIKNISALTQVCREHDVPIIYSVGEKVRNKAERGLALDLWGPGIGKAGGVSDEDADVISELKPRDSDFIISKSKYSAFFDTELEKKMFAMGRSQIIITGIFAHHGCLATALDAYMRNIKVFFVADATADYSREDHDMALSYVAETSGVLTTAGVAIEQLSKV